MDLKRIDAVNNKCPLARTFVVAKKRGDATFASMDKINTYICRNAYIWIRQLTNVNFILTFIVVH